MNYQVRLPIFEGPLDLLLHLIKKNELDIHSVPIALITQQYLEYIELMRTLDLEVAGEFLVMAATLLYIKSRTLLPSAADSSLEEEKDPQEKLIQQLLEYQKYKQAAEQLRLLEAVRAELFPRKQPPEAEKSPGGEICFEASLYDLLSAFKKILEQAKQEEKCYEIEPPSGVSIEEQSGMILARLASEGKITFVSLFGELHSRLEIIVTFLALLELVRRQQVIAQQPIPFGDIWIYPRTPKTEEVASRIH